MRIETKIHDREIFTPTENQIISFIMDHTSQVIGMSLEDLSDQLYVSKSTIIRFCKKLGFAGHKEFCVQLARELNSFMASESELDPSFPFERDDSNSALAEKILALKFNSLNDTFAELDQDAIHTLAKAIHEHRSVTVYTSDENRFAAFELESRLENIGYNVNVIYIQNSMLKRAMSQKPESAVLFISYGQRVPAMPQAARILSEKKIPVFLITGPTRGLLEKYAETIIRIGYYEPSPKVAAFGSSAGLSLILDLLYGYLFEMDHDHNINLVKSESEWQKTENSEPER
ncbi:MAG: MurR/RpiR family transcriptional regulator [Erysipelotrichaceae bacterium]|nr:MurR/RpiR family transcriptional regulator [Erysipelotrichaceae bacterium]